MTKEEWAKVAKGNGISASAFCQRVNRSGWSCEKSATTPKQFPRNKWKSLAKSNGINVRTFSSRIYILGWSLKKAATTPTKIKKSILHNTKDNINEATSGMEIDASKQ